MLTALSIRNVVLIDALDLDFFTGLGVLTGETGAGKSILLDSLGLALGSRGDAGLVRAGTSFASVSATFQLREDHPALKMLVENDLVGEADTIETVILRRRLGADGAGRAFINDQPVSVALLRDIGAQLIEVHGQADDRSLLNVKGHRDLLDTFGNLSAGTADVALVHARWRGAEAALMEAKTQLEASQRDREWLEHAAAELGALNPLAGEEASLTATRTEMHKGARLTEDLNAIIVNLAGSEGGLAALRQAARRLDRIASDHPMLAQALASIDRAVVEASEAEEALADAMRMLTFAPEELDAAEARLFEIRAAARKYRVEADALGVLAGEMAERAAAVVAGEEGLRELTRSVSAAAAVYNSAAAELTIARAAAARRLETAVMAELVPLKLEAARFRVVLVPASPGPSGADMVSFEIATNPGAPFGALTKIASGGELSRFVLALKVASAATGSAGTIIFDEIDRGVGGAVASAIGERLARLASTAQVLVVTHSPQVAARGAHQWRIAKSTDAGVTWTDVHLLDAAARREEIARMLSGAEVTDEARAQAERLLKH